MICVLLVHGSHLRKVTGMTILAILFFWMEMVVLVLALGVYIGGLIRNQLVYEYRIELLDQICAACQANGWMNSEWRYGMYNEVNYNEMVLQFWRRFDSFYPDKSFIDPKATGPQPKQ